MTLTNNTGTDVELVPAMLLINYIECLTPNQSRVQYIYGKEDLWLKTDKYHKKEWKMKSKLLM